MSNNKERLANQLVILGVFLVVASAGLVYGVFHIKPTEPTVQGNAEELIVAPTLEEYHGVVRPLLKPFLEQAVRLNAAEMAVPDAAFADLANKTQRTFLGANIRVPKEARDAHMSFVLVLDKWRRALDGSVGDRDTVVAATEQVMQDNPWLLQ